MEAAKFSLSWNDFERNMTETFTDIREEKEFFDITLACDDNQIEAHKVIISACSTFFRNILRRNPHQHPLLYLKGVKYKEFLSILNFMYSGEVKVAQGDLNSFLAVADDLKVKGLIQGNKGQKPQNGTKQKDKIHLSGCKTIPSDPKQGESKCKKPTQLKSPQSQVAPLTIQSTETVQNENIDNIKSESQPKSNDLLEEKALKPDEVSVNKENESNVLEEDLSYQSKENENQVISEDFQQYEAKVEKGLTQDSLIKKEESRPKHSFRAFAQAWQCEECNTVFSSRKYAKEHMQEFY